MRTASTGGMRPSLRNLRTFAYEAVSTSIEKVENGFLSAETNRLSRTCPYDSVFDSRGGAGARAGTASRRVP